MLFDESYIRYFTNFGFLATERPVAFAGTASGEMAVFVPEFEVDRVRAETDFERIESYPEYPASSTRCCCWRACCVTWGSRCRRRRPGRLSGHPRLPRAGAERGHRAAGDATRVVHREHAGPQERRRGRTDPGERQVVRPRAPAPPAVFRPGATEAEASLRAGHEATLAMLEALGSRRGTGSSDGVSAGYRGQIGLRSSWAHAVAHNIEFQEGDVLVTETAAPIWGTTPSSSGR